MSADPRATTDEPFASVGQSFGFGYTLQGQSRNVEQHITLDELDVTFGDEEHALVVKHALRGGFGQRIPIKVPQVLKTLSKKFSDRLFSRRQPVDASVPGESFNKSLGGAAVAGTYTMIDWGMFGDPPAVMICIDVGVRFSDRYSPEHVLLSLSLHSKQNEVMRKSGTPPDDQLIMPRFHSQSGCFGPRDLFPDTASTVQKARVLELSMEAGAMGTSIVSPKLSRSEVDR